MLSRAPWCVVALLLGTAGSAHALAPGTHADVAKGAHDGMPNPPHAWFSPSDFRHSAGVRGLADLAPAPLRPLIHRI